MNGSNVFSGSNSTSMDKIFLALNIIEILLHFVTYCIVIFCIYVLSRNPFFHIHLIRIFKCIFVYYLISQLMRLVILIEEIKDGDESIDATNITSSTNFLILNSSLHLKIIGIIRFNFLLAMYAAFATCVSERIYATMKLKTYEKIVSNLFFVYCLFYHIPLPAIATYLIYMEYVNLEICGIAIILANVISYFILLFLEWFNKKCYKTSLINSKTYTLSERFQLQENLRTAIFFQKISFFLFLINFVIGASLIASDYLTNNLIRKLANIIFNYFILFYGCTFPLFGVTSNPFCYLLLNRLKSIFYKPQIRPSSPSQMENNRILNLSAQVRGYDGSKMIFTIDEEREMYFKQLQSNWS